MGALSKIEGGGTGNAFVCVLGVSLAERTEGAVGMNPGGKEEVISIILGWWANGWSGGYESWRKRSIDSTISSLMGERP